jgi:hypothetical protein
MFAYSGYLLYNDEIINPLRKDKERAWLPSVEKYSWD